MEFYNMLFGQTQSRFVGFHDLMPHRVQEILLVSSLYDAFILNEDGQLTEQIFSNYLNLNLRYAPRVTRVSTAKEALEVMQKRQFNLVIAMPKIIDMSVFELCREIKVNLPRIPVILLTYNSTELERQREQAKQAGIDRVFVWSGDSSIFLAIIKLIEDAWNVEHDTEIGMVRVIVLVEDSIKYYSSFLPKIYTLLMQQTQELMTRGLNDMDKLMRMRARPKILLAESYEEAIALYNRFKSNVMGVISDIRYPRNGVLDAEAGLELMRYIKPGAPTLPLLLISNETENRSKAEAEGASFLDKNSITLLEDLVQFMRNNYGFGEFVFRKPSGEIIRSAHDLKSLETALKDIPADSLLFHASNNHFSTWLMARSEFALASIIRDHNPEDFENIEGLRQFIIQSIRRFRKAYQQGQITDFTMSHYDAERDFIKIGGGSLGGKARGITFIGNLLSSHEIHNKYKDVRITVPHTLIIGSHEFDAFLDRNALRSFALQCEDDREIARAFLQGKLRDETYEDLSIFLEEIKYPLAVRSSSLLEDSHFQPFAGIYKTFMLPNNHPDFDVRFGQLCAAIQLVYASTFSQASKAYLKATPNRVEEEKMAVVIQQVVGKRHGDNFYPNFSGVVQSYNYFPISHMKPEEGIAYVALGLGKAVVDVGSALQFSPYHPNILPQFSTINDWLKNSQKQFFAIDMSANGSLEFDDETFLAKLELEQAMIDGTLDDIGSAYVTADQVIRDGVYHKGPKIVSFANILKHRSFPLAEILQDLLKIGGVGMGCPVEMEFAVNISKEKGVPSEFSFLQIRPMVAGGERQDVEIIDAAPERLLIHSSKALGHGLIDGIRDIIYVKPQTFDPAFTRNIAAEIGAINEGIKRPYLVIGLGRWGTSDPWLGIPVNWKQISHAKVIVEAGTANFNIDLSMGTHFFQNITSLRIGYLTVPHHSKDSFIDWDWLNAQPAECDSDYVRHIRLETPLQCRIDGRKSSGAVYKPQ